MVFVDIHCHLTEEPLLSKVDEIIQKAKEANVSRIITNATNPKSNRLAIELSKKYPVVKASLGFYPTYTCEFSEKEIEDEIKFIQKQKPIAIGEVGLDYKFTSEEHLQNISIEEQERRKAIQKKYFQKFIDLAKKLNVPIIVHSRKAELDVIEMLEASNYNKIVMHCFSGKKQLVDRVIKNNWFISIPVTVIKLQQFQEMVKKAKLSQILTETDAPWLGPEPGLNNEPKNVILSVRKIAELKGFNEKEIEDQIYLNYKRLFE
jgi:TatD DNase family protein